MPFPRTPFYSTLTQSPIPTEVPSDLCDHNGPTSELNKDKSTRTISSTSSGNLPVFPIASITDKGCFTSLRPHNDPTSEPNYTDRHSMTFLLILATIMVPHRNPVNTSRWLHSRRHPILTKVLRSSSSYAFSSDSLLSNLSQSILYWQKFLLIIATIAVPHRSPTKTSRREQSHPHPSATFPSNAFPSGSLLFQSFPKHPNWQKLLLILATIMVPHRSPTGRSSSNPCDHQAMPFPLTPFDSSLSIASPIAPPRTDDQAMPFPHNGPTSEHNKYKSTRTSPTTDSSTPVCLTPPQIHVRRQTIFRDFPWFYSILPYSMVLLMFSVVLLVFYMVLLNFSRVLLDFSVVFTPFSHSFTPFFHGLPNFQVVWLDFSMVLFDFSIILPFHSSLPKCTSEDGSGGNRYPTVTQLPPGT